MCGAVSVWMGVRQGKPLQIQSFIVVLSVIRMNKLRRRCVKSERTAKNKQ
jgi:hypothetical protein